MHARSLVFGALVAFQAVVMVGMAAAEEMRVGRGIEVTLQTVPVDPRDPFRGDYVTLAYEISTLEYPGPPFRPGDTLFVHLVESSDGWVAAGVSRYRDNSWDVALRGTVVRRNPLRLEYGIEAYFVPEGRGHEVERARDVDAVVSVDRDGRARLRYLVVDGRRWDG